MGTERDYTHIGMFANDFDETGGGYIVVGVAEENGHAIRPVVGIDSDHFSLVKTTNKDESHESLFKRFV